MEETFAVVRVELDGALLALDVRRVREVLGETEITKVPGPRGLVGVLPWDGRALAVVDLAAFLGVGGESTQKRARAVVVEVEDATVALPIDRVYEPSEIAGTQPAHAMRVPFAEQEVDVEGTWIPLIRMDALVASFDGATG